MPSVDMPAGSRVADPAANASVPGLMLARQLFEGGRPEHALGACERLLFDQPQLEAVRLFKATILLRNGQFDEAIVALRRLVLDNPGHAEARPMLAEVDVMRQLRNRTLRARIRVGECDVLRFLGAGREGAAYLVRDRRGAKRVIKLLHPHAVDQVNGDGPLYAWRTPVRRSAQVLVGMADALRRSPSTIDTLYPFDVIEANGRIEGFTYPYEPLVRLSGRRVRIPGMGAAIVGAFVRTQAFLCATVGATLIDAGLPNFMMTRAGRIRFIDYGPSLVWATDCGRLDHPELFAFIRLVCKVFKPSAGHGLDPAHLDTVFEAAARLEDIADGHSWLTTALGEIQRGALEQFTNCRFYHTLAADLPLRPAPAAVAVLHAVDVLSRTTQALRERHQR